MGRKAKSAKTEKSANLKPRKVGKSTGRKKLAAPEPELPPAEPGQGAKRLRSSVNSLLASESDRIARALFDKTLVGNISSARLLVQISGANRPPDEDDDGWDDYDGPSLVELLAGKPKPCLPAPTQSVEGPQSLPALPAPKLGS